MRQHPLFTVCTQYYHQIIISNYIKVKLTKIT